MSQSDYQNPKPHADIAQRRPTDTLWFTVLFGSIAVGLGMTVFAPVGDDPPPALPMTPALPLTSTTTAPTAATTSPGM